MDFLEILAFIVGLIYFMSRSKRKSETKVVPPAPQNTDQPASPRGEKNLEDIFREIMRQQMPVAKEIRVEEPEPEYILRRPVQSEVNKPKNKTVERVISLSKNKENVRHMPDFDLRQAVIYDAILNRPYP